MILPFGDRVASPIIDLGESDFILSFEKLEAARYAEYLSPNGKIIVNTQEIDPMPVIVGKAVYPSHVLNELESKDVTVDAVDALSLAEQAGTAKAVNVVLLGRLARSLPAVPKEAWIDAIKSSVKPKFVEVNLRAFDLGYALD